MNRTLAAGCLLSVGGLAAYLVGVTTPYPGRAYSVTAIMIGVSLLAVGLGEP